MRGLKLVVLAAMVTSTAALARPGHVAHAACVSPRPFGDVDSSFAVGPEDALLMLRDIVDLPLPTAYCSAADVDCNGVINAVDSLKILRYAAGLPYNQIQPCPAIGQIIDQT